MGEMTGRRLIKLLWNPANWKVDGDRLITKDGKYFFFYPSCVCLRRNNRNITIEYDANPSMMLIWKFIYYVRLWKITR